MPVEIAGIDHIFIAVRNPRTATFFYDRVMPILGFRRWETPLADEPHIVYSNRRLAYVLRPAREGTPDHDPYAPGLHHLSFKTTDEKAVDRAEKELTEAGIRVTKARYYPEYAPDYYAIFLEDPDGLRLEVMNFRELR